MDRTAVNQPPFGGSIYPFTEDVALAAVVLDAYLSYEDDTCAYEHPFTLAVAQDGSGFNATVTDANGATVLTAASVDARTTDWGDDRRVYEWTIGENVFRLVVDHTALTTGSGPLDPRVVNRLPERVRSLRIGLLQFRGLLVLQAGYNVDIGVEQDIERIDGGRFFHLVNLDGVAGAGEGRLTGCEEVEPLVRRVNRITPDEAGNFKIEADDCFRQQPSLFVSEPAGVRVAEYSAAGLSREEARSAVKLYDDCRPCCECDYFVRTYRGLKRMWDRWKKIAADAEEVRDAFGQNRDRWLAQLECRLANPLRLVAITEPGCKTFMGGIYCNMSKCCLTGLELRFTLQRYRNGVLLTDPPTVILNESYIDGSATDGEEKYTPLFYSPTVRWPIMRYDFEYTNPQETSMAKLRLCVTCESADSIKITLSAHAPDPAPAPTTNELCALPTPAVPPDIQALWDDYGVPANTMRAIVSKTIPLNPVPPKYTCECV